MKSEIGSINPFLLSIHPRRSLKVNLTSLKAPINFIRGEINFRIVADSGRKCGIAIVEPFGVGTKLEFSSILVLGGRTLPETLIFILVKLTNWFGSGNS
jgi:hypothetical protein